MLGVTQQAVGKWETGRSTPDPQTVAQLAEILDTPADVLLGAAQGAGCVLRCGPQCVQPLYRVSGPGCGHGARRVRCAGAEEDYGKEYACVRDPENYFFSGCQGRQHGAAYFRWRSCACPPPEYARQRRPWRAGLRLRRRRYAEKVHPARQLGRAAPLNPAYEEMVIKGRSWITFTSQARSWRPRPSGDFSLRIYIVA